MDKRKEEIVEVALRRFCHYGFNKTTMNEIAEDMKITKANLYYYYQDKSALIRDVISTVADELFGKEEVIVANYTKDLMATLYEILELRASYLSKYYMLHIDENLEWIKGVDMASVIEELYQRDVAATKALFSKSVNFGDVRIKDVEEASIAFVEIMKSLGIMYNVQDIISGIPNKENISHIVDSQKRAIRLIFEERIIEQ
ncbi:TetR/AcrR family transcriptional regulator [Sphingobacterium faecale]|uniref:TetR/AcrR family transcriptional regulator n=1 Tax=Sphingobacterium faecale TaxID=2803775 RepID=A0ABS1R1H6_9SPHI|nr:TetR/AcrR family transcriptional regulator [Sphingobacterium faecale]MBL1408513.1 TetR/AcrR family transcriptional regulator [Sphingobacterium faecale]